MCTTLIKESEEHHKDAGQLSKDDILKAKENDGLKIIPFEERQIKGASYDITPTLIAMSSKYGMLETVYRSKTFPFKYYIYVKAKDTVLVVSREFISMPSNIAGYVVSRVSKVSEGFGHVSTSIDPNWKGALLIALSNPSNKPIKVYVGEDNCNETDDSPKRDSLATVSFHYLNTPCRDKSSVYEGMRLDLLNKLKYTERHSIKAWFRKTFHPKRVRFTNFFFDYCLKKSLTEDNWENIVKEFQGVRETKDCVYCKNYISRNSHSERHISDFIITENLISRIANWISAHWTAIRSIIFVIIVLLTALGVIPEWIIKLAS